MCGKTGACQRSQRGKPRFDLSGRMQIHAMWHMICLTDIHASFRVVESTSSSARVQLVDEYTFGDTGRLTYIWNVNSNESPTLKIMPHASTSRFLEPIIQSAWEVRA